MTLVLSKMLTYAFKFVEISKVVVHMSLVAFDVSKVVIIAVLPLRQGQRNLNFAKYCGHAHGDMHL